MEITSLRDNCGSDLDNAGHVTLPVTWLFDSPCALSYWRSVITNNHVSILNGYRDMKPERYPGHDLDLWVHVMSSVTWPFVSPCGVSYMWSMLTRRLSGTVIEIFSLEDIGVTALTFWGHVTSSVTWPFNSPWGISYRWSMVTRRLSGTVIGIFSLEYTAVTTLTFGVTWRHRSRDHPTPHGVFPIGGQWRPDVYLARLLRY